MKNNVAVNYKKAEELVRAVLLEDPETRADDKRLVIAVWERQGVVFTDQQKALIDKCIAAETITRSRRILQEHGIGLPLDSSKIAQRLFMEKETREYFREKGGENYGKKEKSS